eukprot:2673055-Pleurochrysis_carterae.AAC.6
MSAPACALALSASSPASAAQRARVWTTWAFASSSCVERAVTRASDALSRADAALEHAWSRSASCRCSRASCCVQMSRSTTCLRDPKNGCVTGEGALSTTAGWRGRPQGQRIACNTQCKTNMAAPEARECQHADQPRMREMFRAM